MEIVRCENGHFFDQHIYRTCPHCGANVAAQSAFPSGVVINQKDQPGKKKGGRLFGFKRGKAESVLVEPPSYNSGQKLVPYSTPSERVEYVPPQNYSSNSTQGMWDIEEREEPPETDIDPYNSQSVNPEPVFDEPESPSAENAGSLEEAIKKASANEEGKTMGYFNAMVTDRSEVEPRQNIDPVVGWLVCVSGQHFGESFQIYAGINPVGRSQSNRIVLSRDDSVSRERHSLIVYEPKKRSFYLQPGDSNGLTYLNDDYITETKSLTRMDRIELGNSKLLFIPLCDDSFTWEDHINHKEQG